MLAVQAAAGTTALLEHVAMVANWGGLLSTQTTSGRSPLHAVDKSHHAHHVTRVSHIVGAAKTVIGPPVHP